MGLLEPLHGLRISRGTDLSSDQAGYGRNRAELIHLEILQIDPHSETLLDPNQQIYQAQRVNRTRFEKIGLWRRHLYVQRFREDTRDLPLERLRCARRLGDAHILSKRLPASRDAISPRGALSAAIILSIRIHSSAVATRIPPSPPAATVPGTASHGWPVRATFLTATTSRPSRASGEPHGDGRGP